MNIDVSDAFAIQRVTLDEVQDFVAICHDGGRQVLQQFDDRVAIAQVSTGDLTAVSYTHLDVYKRQI